MIRLFADENIDVRQSAAESLGIPRKRIEKRGGKAVLVFRFDDPDNALNILQKRGVNVVAGVDLLKQS